MLKGVSCFLIFWRPQVAKHYRRFAWHSMIWFRWYLNLSFPDIRSSNYQKYGALSLTCDKRRHLEFVPNFAVDCIVARWVYIWRAWKSAEWRITWCSSVYLNSSSDRFARFRREWVVSSYSGVLKLPSIIAVLLDTPWSDFADIWTFLSRT